MLQRYKPYAILYGIDYGADFCGPFRGLVKLVGVLCGGPIKMLISGFVEDNIYTLLERQTSGVSQLIKFTQNVRLNVTTIGFRECGNSILAALGNSCLGFNVLSVRALGCLFHSFLLYRNYLMYSALLYKNPINRGKSLKEDLYEKISWGR